MRKVVVEVDDVISSMIRDGVWSETLPPLVKDDEGPAHQSLKGPDDFERTFGFKLSFTPPD